MAAKPSKSTPKPLVTLELGDFGGTNEFFSLQEIYDWIEDEQKKWSFLSSRSGPNQDQLNVLDEFKNLRSEFEEVRRIQGNNGKDADGIATAIAEQFKQRMTEYFVKSRRHIHSNSRLGKFILNLKDQDIEQAAWVWWIWARKNQISMQRTAWLCPEMFIAVFKAVAFQIGFDATADELRAFEALRSEWRTILATERIEFSQQLEQAATLKSELADQIAKLTELMASVETEHESLRVLHNDEMESIQDKFRDELAVRSSVEYWGTKAKEHKISAEFWGLCAIGSGVISFIVLLVLPWLIGGLPTDVKSIIDAGSLGEAGNLAVLTHSSVIMGIRTLAFALLSLWPVRIFVRNYMSESHLSTDASERQIVVKTYLALLNDPDLADKEGLKEQILPHALQRIFRHTADGIVKDDGLPWQSVADALKGRVSPP